MKHKLSFFPHTSLLLSISVIIALAMTRGYLITETEPDFIVSFTGEAKRLLAGEPLLILHHLPLYSALIAVLYSIFDSWIFAGILLSVLSGIGVIMISYLFMNKLAGKTAAYGSLLGLAACTSFLMHSAMAASDIFFLFLFYSSCLLILTSSQLHCARHWGLAGLVTGLALITRTNSVSLLIFCFLPYVSSEKDKRFKNTAAFLGGLTLPVAIWITLASVSGAPWTPRNTYINIAMTYFAPDSNRTSAEAYDFAKHHFNNLWEVLTYNPGRLVSIYLKDFAGAAARTILKLTIPLIGIPALAGLFRLGQKSVRPYSYFFIVVLISQIILLNFKAYEYRYYLFLVPVLGAAAAYAFNMLFQLFMPRLGVTFKNGFVTTLFVLGLTLCGIQAYVRLHPYFETELKEIMPLARQIIQPGDRLIARNPHLAFYTGAEPAGFPYAVSLQELRLKLEAYTDKKPTYLYFGNYARLQRKELSSLLNPKTNTSGWLERVKSSEPPGRWALFRVTNSSNK